MLTVYHFYLTAKMYSLNLSPTSGEISTPPGPSPFATIVPRSTTPGTNQDTDWSTYTWDIPPPSLIWSILIPFPDTIHLFQCGSPKNMSGYLDSDSSWTSPRNFLLSPIYHETLKLHQLAHDAIFKPISYQLLYTSNSLPQAENKEPARLW